MDEEEDGADDSGPAEQGGDEDIELTANTVSRWSRVEWIPVNTNTSKIYGMVCVGLTCILNTI